MTICSRRSIFAVGFILFCFDAQVSDGATSSVLELSVADASGQSLGDAEAILYPGGKQLCEYPRWKHAVNGTVSFTEDDNPGKAWKEKFEGDYRIIVRAPGHAASLLDVTIPAEPSKRDVVLTAGRELRVHLKTHDGKPLPKSLRPTVFYPEQAQRVLGNVALFGFEGSDKDALGLYRAESKAEGEYLIRIPDVERPISVLVDHPGVLRTFEAGPFEPSEIADGKLSIDLPAPGKIAIAPPSDSKAVQSSKAYLFRYRPNLGPGVFLYRIGHYDRSVGADTVISELAPGAYVVTGVRKGSAQIRINVNPDETARLEAEETSSEAPKPTAAGQAPAAKSSDEKSTLMVSNQPIEDVLKMLGELGDVKLAAKGKVIGQTITLKIRNVTVRAAMQAIVGTRPDWFWHQPDLGKESYELWDRKSFSDSSARKASSER